MMSSGSRDTRDAQNATSSSPDTCAVDAGASASASKRTASGIGGGLPVTARDRLVRSVRRSEERERGQKRHVVGVDAVARHTSLAGGAQNDVDHVVLRPPPVEEP